MSPRRERKPQPVPELTRPRKQRLPSIAERVLPNGLRVVAVRRASVPLVHLRLRVPNAIRRDADLAKTSLLSRTIMLGTSRRSQGELAEALQRIGGGLRVDDGADGLSFAGESLRSGLGDLLGLLAEVLTDAAFPRAAAEREAGRLSDHLRRALSQPGTVADEAWLNRRYGDHPYGRSLPTPDEVADGGAALAEGAAPAPGRPSREPAGARRRPDTRPRPRPGREGPRRLARQRQQAPTYPGCPTCHGCRCCSSTARARCSPTSASAVVRPAVPMTGTPPDSSPTASTAARSRRG